MKAVNNEPLMDVLSNYSFDVLDIKSETYKEKKGVWWINTNKGMKILKKVSNSEETLRYILDAIRHLSINGVYLPAINKTKNEAEYVNLGGSCFTLTNAIEGKTPVYSSSKELAIIVSGMAAFHKASLGFIPAEDTKPKYHLGLWVLDYTEQLEDIDEFFKKDCLNRSNSQISNVIIKEYPAFYERALKSIDGLSGSDYAKWVEDARVKGSLCHQDFAAGNLILTPADRLCVLDTDSITIDIAARDIRKLLNKIMKKAGCWNMELTGKILEEYQKTNPLTISQWNVVKLDLMFPHLFIGAVNKYYYRRDKEWSDDKYLQRITEMSAFEKTVIPIVQNFDALIPASAK